MIKNNQDYQSILILIVVHNNLIEISKHFSLGIQLFVVYVKILLRYDYQ